MRGRKIDQHITGCNQRGKIIAFVDAACIFLTICCNCVDQGLTHAARAANDTYFHNRHPDFVSGSYYIKEPKQVVLCSPLAAADR
jgi:hypothetical protein